VSPSDQAPAPRITSVPPRAYLTDAAEFNLQEIEPRFGLLYAEHLATTGQPTEARDLVGKLLAHRTTDTAYAAVQLWSERLDQFVAAQSRREQDIPPDRKPRMVRPRDRVHPNPYRVYG
jgi:hypothetical protein